MSGAIVPELRFPEFNTAWRKSELGHHTKITTGRLDANAMVENGRYPFFTCAKEVYKIDTAAFETEALLVSGNGANVGYVHYYNGKFNAYQRTYVLDQFNQEILFIEQLLRSRLRKRIFKEAKEGNTPYIVKSTLSEMPVVLPSLPEQKKIAAFLSAVDQKLAALEAQLAGWRDYKRGLMQALFSQSLRFKADDDSDFPDWEGKKLRDILSIGSGRDHKHLGDGTIPVYGTGGFMRYVGEHLYEGDSVGIGRKGTIDQPMWLSGKFWTVDTLFYTHSFNGVLPQFLYAIFQRINWKKYNEASGVPSLSKRTIEEISVALPSLPEQRKIADALSAVDAKIDALSDRAEKTREFKRGLLQKMFV